MNADVAHYYRMFRGNLDRTAEDAFQSARSHVYFLKRLGKTVRASKNRSLAAKRAWKKRRAS